MGLNFKAIFSMLSPNNKKVKKILLTGGGTGGSVAPLLAIADNLNPQRDEAGGVSFLWIGTKNGVEREMVEKEKIKFMAIAAGKLRRYFSWQNFVDLFLILIGFFQSLFLISKWKPNIIITAGSFVSVPVVWAGWILRVPILVHQQDVQPGLANKLMAPFARVITVAFEKSLIDYGEKAIWTGNPVRKNFQSTINKTRNNKFFKLKKDLPIIFVVGGGTGAKAINDLVEGSLNELTRICQIIHATGKSKGSAVKRENYYAFEFLNFEQMSEAYSLADVVVSRCGMGALTELSFLSKPSILVPMPDSHQEENAKVFSENNAAIVLNQKKLTPQMFFDEIKKIINNKETKKMLSENIDNVMKKEANEAIVKIVNIVLN